MKRLRTDDDRLIDPLAVAIEDMVRTVYARIELLDEISLQWLADRMQAHEAESYSRRPHGLVGPTAAVRYFAAVRALGVHQQALAVPPPASESTTRIVPQGAYFIDADGRCIIDKLETNGRV